MSQPSSDTFVSRHIGPRPADLDAMLKAVGAPSLDALIDQAVPASIRLDRPLALPEAEAEHAFLARLRGVAAKNQVCRSYIGMGYAGTITPAVILRNVFENPGWYTPYTPYQAEIAQGRLESLLNFQTMVKDLTAMDVANASLLDEATAAAEAMTMIHRLQAKRAASGAEAFLVSERAFPQTIELLKTRAEPFGIELRVGDLATMPLEGAFGALVQYPNGHGELEDLGAFVTRAHEAGLLVAVATDLLALTLVTPPGEQGADIVFGNSQRFGVPLGYGGPHAAFFATREAYVRQMPGRVIGVSVDAHGHQAYRMALQTREQHIRREKATSNICTAQALLANMAAMYARVPRAGGAEGDRAAGPRHDRRARRRAGGARRSPDQQGVLRHAPDRDGVGHRDRAHPEGRAGAADQLPLRRRHAHRRHVRRDGHGGGRPGRRRRVRRGVGQGRRSARPPPPRSRPSRRRSRARRRS